MTPSHALRAPHLDIQTPTGILDGMKITSPHTQQTTPGRRAALYGVLAAMALVAGYLEMLLPLPATVPGIKLGIGNAVILFALERMGAKPAFFLMLAKVICSTVLFANPQMFIFSLAGGVLSWAIMACANKSGLFSVVATSVLGGIAHNAGQLAAVALVLSPTVAWINAPALAIAGVICGLAVGVLVRGVLAAIPRGANHA